MPPTPPNTIPQAPSMLPWSNRLPSQLPTMLPIAVQIPMAVFIVGSLSHGCPVVVTERTDLAAEFKHGECLCEDLRIKLGTDHKLMSV